MLRPRALGRERPGALHTFVFFLPSIALWHGEMCAVFVKIYGFRHENVGGIGGGGVPHWNREKRKLSRSDFS